MSIGHGDTKLQMIPRDNDTADRVKVIEGPIPFPNLWCSLDTEMSEHGGGPCRIENLRISAK